MTRPASSHPCLQVVAAFTAMSRPWLVAWSLSPEIDAPSTTAQHDSAAELSLLMQFRAQHFGELFDFAGAARPGSAASFKAARVGVLADWRYNVGCDDACSRSDDGGQPQVRAPAQNLRAMGVEYRFETSRTILECAAHCARATRPASCTRRRVLGRK